MMVVVIVPLLSFLSDQLYRGGAWARIEGGLKPSPLESDKLSYSVERLSRVTALFTLRGWDGIALCRPLDEVRRGHRRHPRGLCSPGEEGTLL